MGFGIGVNANVGIVGVSAVAKRTAYTWKQEGTTSDIQFGWQAEENISASLGFYTASYNIIDYEHENVPNCTCGFYPWEEDPNCIGWRKRDEVGKGKVKNEITLGAGLYIGVGGDFSVSLDLQKLDIKTREYIRDLGLE